MLILCHDESCRGHDERAGSVPEDACWFCGSPLLDSSGELLVIADLRRVPPRLVDPRAADVCGVLGHVFEGRVLAPFSAAGECARCGLRVAFSG